MKGVNGVYGAETLKWVVFTSVWKNQIDRYALRRQARWINHGQNTILVLLKVCIFSRGHTWISSAGAAEGEHYERFKPTKETDGIIRSFRARVERAGIIEQQTKILESGMQNLRSGNTLPEMSLWGLNNFSGDAKGNGRKLYAGISHWDISSRKSSSNLATRSTR